VYGCVCVCVCVCVHLWCACAVPPPNPCPTYQREVVVVWRLAPCTVGCAVGWCYQRRHGVELPQNAAGDVDGVERLLAFRICLPLNCACRKNGACCCGRCPATAPNHPHQRRRQPMADAVLVVVGRGVRPRVGPPVARVHHTARLPTVPSPTARHGLVTCGLGAMHGGEVSHQSGAAIKFDFAQRSTHPHVKKT
jgi:hypothetical protein